MIRLMLILLLISRMFEAHAASDMPRYPRLIGKSYLKMRSFLINHGNQPIDWTREHGDCVVGSDVCRFHELQGCAVDVPDCIFVWRAKDGRFLHVETGTPESGLLISSVWEEDHE